MSQYSPDNILPLITLFIAKAGLPMQKLCGTYTDDLGFQSRVTGP